MHTPWSHILLYTVVCILCQLLLPYFQAFIPNFNPPTTMRIIAFPRLHHTLPYTYIYDPISMMHDTRFGQQSDALTLELHRSIERHLPCGMKDKQYQSNVDLEVRS